MTRNTNSQFALNPTRLDMSRSSFDRSSSYKTTFNVGDLVPFFVDEVLPGDTFDVQTSKLVRMQTLIVPLMDDIYLDTYYFFVPNRIVWQHWREMMGENTQSAWIPTVEYSVPQITSPSGGWNVGTIADYFGIPTGVSNLSVNALPFRAYAMICNEWFRDENLTDPLNIPDGDAAVPGSNGNVYVSDVAKGGVPFKVSKYHDYFTSALPAPQKGPDVQLPTVEVSEFPVYARPNFVPGFEWPPNGANAPANTSPLYYNSLQFVPGTTPPTSADVPATQLTTTSFRQAAGSDLDTRGHVDVQWVSNGVSPVNPGLTPVNLWASSSGLSSVVTINQLRTAFQIQKFYERQARGGTRYIELLKSHFGVTSPDARLQRPEYLGGNRIPININQVVQSSATDSETPQGNTAAYSLTTDTHGDFKKSFVEHGFVIGLMCARYKHSYQQGLERFWSRRDKFDYYWPVFANIGEQAILNKEIYAQGTDVDDEVFGYQEAWADYRYKPSRVTGEMRSTYAQSLDSWHLGDYYTSLPKLSDSWIREDSSVVNRAIAVSDRVSNQLFCDIHVKCWCRRPMPLYSIPGLVDHH